MAFPATVFQVFVASPGDVQAERQAVQEVLQAWNAVHARDLQAVLLPLPWESHATPEMGDRPQAIIKQIGSHADMLVGIFWTRLGTPTGQASSGTAEEIQEFRREGKPVLLYFSSVPVALDSIDQEEYTRLREFKRLCQQEGLTSSYSSVGEFRDLLHRHLLEVVREHTRASDISASEQGSSDGLGSKPLTFFAAEYESFLRRLDAEWAAERDSDPMGIDVGKLILRGASSSLLDLRASPVVEAYPELAARLDSVLREISALQRHMLFIDGGVSYRQFWKAGDDIVGELRATLHLIRQYAQRDATITEVA